MNPITIGRELRKSALQLPAPSIAKLIILQLPAPAPVKRDSQGGMENAVNHFGVSHGE